MLALQVSILIILAVILWEDLLWRSVHLFLFPCLVLLFTAIRWISGTSLSALLLPAAWNIGCLAFQFLLLSLYFSIRKRRWVNLTHGLLGWGDILFLTSIAFYFSFANYLIAFTGSLILSLVIWSVWQLMKGQKEKRVPLAGLQALAVGLFLAGSWWITPINLTSDNWLLTFLDK